MNWNLSSNLSHSFPLFPDISNVDIRFWNKKLSSRHAACLFLSVTVFEHPTVFYKVRQVFDPIVSMNLDLKSFVPNKANYCSQKTKFSAWS